MKNRKDRESTTELNGIDILNASSANDFTGLMPTPAKSHEAREAYDEILNLAPPQKSAKRQGRSGK